MSFDDLLFLPVDARGTYDANAVHIDNHFALRHPDFLVIMATIHGGYANRNLLIPQFVKALLDSPIHADLNDVFVQTNRAIIDQTGQSGSQYALAQIAEKRSTLTRLLFLHNVFNKERKCLESEVKSPRSTERESCEDEPVYDTLPSDVENAYENIPSRGASRNRRVVSGTSASRSTGPSILTSFINVVTTGFFGKKKVKNGSLGSGLSKSLEYGIDQ